MIENPASVEQEFQFGFVMAKTALISNITLSSSTGNVIKSTADASQWAHCFLTYEPENSTNQGGNISKIQNMQREMSHQNGDANGNNVNGQHHANGHHANGHHANGHHANGNHANGHHANGQHHANGHNANGSPNGKEDDLSSSPSFDICDKYGQNRHGEHISYLHHSEDFKQFVLPIKLAPHSNSTLSFVYEYLLERADNTYTQTVTANPGQLVADFEIRLHVVENRPIKGLKLDVPALGEITHFYEDELRDNEFFFDFKMNITEQFNSFGQHGYTGDFMVSYDLEEDHSIPVDLITKDDFFVHFYEIPRSKTMKSIPKHVIFLLDISGIYFGNNIHNISVDFLSCI